MRNVERWKWSGVGNRGSTLQMSPGQSSFKHSQRLFETLRLIAAVSDVRLVSLRWSRPAVKRCSTHMCSAVAYFHSLSLIDEPTCSFVPRFTQPISFILHTHISHFCKLRSRLISAHDQQSTFTPADVDNRLITTTSACSVGVKSHSTKKPLRRC